MCKFCWIDGVHISFSNLSVQLYVLYSVWTTLCQISAPNLNFHFLFESLHFICRCSGRDVISFRFLIKQAENGPEMRRIEAPSLTRLFLSVSAWMNQQPFCFLTRPKNIRISGVRQQKLRSLWLLCIFEAPLVYIQIATWTQNANLSW